jgi:hypothetical protein
MTGMMSNTTSEALVKEPLPECRTADSRGHLLGTLHTQADVAIVVTNNDKCLQLLNATCIELERISDVHADH